jgi:hypothetical protein
VIDELLQKLLSFEKKRRKKSFKQKTKKLPLIFVNDNFKIIIVLSCIINVQNTDNM